MSPTRYYPLCLLAMVMVVLAGCESPTLVEAPAVTFDARDATGLVQASKTTASFIEDQYIVLFKEETPNAPSLAHNLIEANNGETLFIYRHAIKGFAAVLSEGAANTIAEHPDVVVVQQDVMGEIVDDQPNPPAWGIDRIDQRALPFDNNYHYDTDGSGVHVYVLDTGLDHDHPDFGGRTMFGADFVPTDGNTNAEDIHGHGTHVSGTVASATYGVAKGATIVSMQVCNPAGGCPLSGTIAGVDSVTAMHTTHVGGPSVANMSLRYFSAPGLNPAIANATAAGVTFAVAAGNDNNLDACTVFPASSAEAITVGATASNDVKASFSNIGTCVDIFAPGVSILSTWPGGSTNTISGTSMASPHVAGVAALYLEDNPGAPPNAPNPSVRSAILDSATAGVVINAGAGSPNLLLYNGVLGSGPAINSLAINKLKRKANGVKVAKLLWDDSQISTNKVALYVDGVKVKRTLNDGGSGVKIQAPGDGPFEIHLCEKGSTTICSNSVSADFAGVPIDLTYIEDDEEDK